MPTRGENANSTQKDSSLARNLGLSCCGAAVLTTAPPCHAIHPFIYTHTLSLSLTCALINSLWSVTWLSHLNIKTKGTDIQSWLKFSSVLTAAWTKPKSCLQKCSCYKVYKCTRQNFSFKSARLMRKTLHKILPSKQGQHIFNNLWRGSKFRLYSSIELAHQDLWYHLLRYNCDSFFLSSFFLPR